MTDAFPNYDERTGLPICGYTSGMHTVFYPRSGVVKELGSMLPDFLGSVSTTLRWKGSVDYNGVPLQAVDVSMPNMYERTYFFDPSNGLLALIIENDSLNSDFAPRPETRIEWKIIHEYLPIGESLLPSLESFFRGTTLTILATKPRFLPRDTHIFNRD